MSFLYIFFGLIFGFLLGALYIRSSCNSHETKPVNCSHRLTPAEIAGLVAAILVPVMPKIIPKVVLETDKTVVFKHPKPTYKVHLMFIPKKDIKDIGALSEEDYIYLIDLFKAVNHMVDKLELSNYRLWTNGPGIQDVAYLHFHLGADE